jgi:hypothetical protein
VSRATRLHRSQEICVTTNTSRPLAPSGPERWTSGPEKWASGPEKWASRPARVAQSGRFGAEWALCWADTGATRTHRGRLEGPTGRTPGLCRAHTRSAELGHGRPTRGGEGGDSVRRVARAGSHSAERVGARHYRARRHFLSTSCAAPSYSPQTTASRSPQRLAMH